VAEPEARVRLFLSHASDDAELARAVSRCLNGTGRLEVAQMAEQIRSADDWSERIRSELAVCDAALFLVSPNFVERAWFFIEWAASWVQEKRPHLLLIDVTGDDLLGIMRERQVTAFKEGAGALADLVASLMGLRARNALCINVGGDLHDLITAERRYWVESKWARLSDAVKQGVAVLPHEDMAWIVANDRLEELLELMRDSFAHPTLVHQTAGYLVKTGRALKAVALGDLVYGSVQVAIFRQLVIERNTEAALDLAAMIVDRESRRACGRIAADEHEPELAEQVAEMTEYSYDRRVIAERLLDAGAANVGALVMERADKNHDKASFAARCIAAGLVDPALEVASTMSVSKDLRVLGESLLDAGHADRLDELVEFMEKNAEKARLALYALEHGQLDAVEVIARTITTSKDLLKIAVPAYEKGQAKLALSIVLLMKYNEQRREFFEHASVRGDRALISEAATALSTNRERRLLAEALCEAGLSAEAIRLAGSLTSDAERRRLVWAALSWSDDKVAAAALEGLSSAADRETLRAVMTAARIGEGPEA
jgi:hypothetical protein